MSTDPTSTRHAGGAPMLPPALAYVVLSAVGIVLPPLLAGVSSYGDDRGLLAFYGQHPGPARLLAFCVLGSAVPFAVCTAVASHRVLAGGMDVPGRLIALVGGGVAAGLLTLSGLASFALVQPLVADDAGVVRALQGLAFAAGGPGFVVFSGLLVAGVSVPLLVGRLAPAWLGRAGLVLAAVCEVSALCLLFDGLTFLLPVGRFGTMAWLLAAAATFRAKGSR